MDERTQIKGDIEALIALLDAIKRDGGSGDDAVRAATLVLSERRAELARLDDH